MIEAILGKKKVKRRLHERTPAQAITSHVSDIVLGLQGVEETNSIVLREELTTETSTVGEPKADLARLARSFPAWIQDRDARLEKLREL
jgi:hypothetical protein